MPFFRLSVIIQAVGGRNVLIALTAVIGLGLALVSISVLILILLTSLIHPYKVGYRRHIVAADGTVGPFLHFSYAVFCITLHSFNIVWSGNRHGLTAF